MNSEYIKEFESIIYDFLESYKAQGLAISIFDKNNVLYQNFFGKRDIEKNLEIDGNTIFGIASITKSFTCITVLKLVEMGIVNIDDPITKYLPELDFKNHAVPSLSHLMSHSAGFFPQKRFLITDFIENLNLKDPKDEIYINSLIAEKGFEEISNTLKNMNSFTGNPGEYFSYSNFSYGIITELIRRYGNSDSYCGTVEKNILSPMNLSRTFFDFHRTTLETNIAKLYVNTNDTISYSTDYKDQGYVLMGGGGLKSTLNDMQKYTQMFMNFGNSDSKNIISKELIKSMEFPRIDYKLYEKYGFGLALGTIDNISFSCHSGGLPGVSSFFGFSRDISKGVVILCNTENVPVTALGMAALKLSNNVLPALKIYDYEERVWSDEKISKSIGTFESKEGDKVRVFHRDGKLLIESNDHLFEAKTSIKDSLIIKNKLLEIPYRLLRNQDGTPWGICSPSRILPKK